MEVHNLEGGVAEDVGLVVRLDPSPVGRSVAHDAFDSIPPGACVERSYLPTTPGAGSIRVMAFIMDPWDGRISNNVAAADGWALADVGVGVTVPVGGPDV